MDIVYFNSLMLGITLVAVALAVLALLTGLFWFGVRLSARVSTLERGQEAFQNQIAKLIEDRMKEKGDEEVGTNA